MGCDKIGCPMSGSYSDEIYFGGSEWKIEPLASTSEDELHKEIFEFWEKLVTYSFMVNFRSMTQSEKLLDRYPEAQTNDKNEIAVKYRQPGNVLLQDNPSGLEYVAITQANICLAWIDPADVDFIMAKRDGCCGKKQPSFSLANESDVRRWTNKGGQ